MDVLTPGYFLIGCPLEALPDPLSSFQPQSLLQCWQLCQSLTRHFWQRWSKEYLSQLQKYTKWNHSMRNFQVGDVVCLHEDGFAPLKWLLARGISVFPGEDGLVRVVTIKTRKGTYKRPANKISLILPIEH